MFCKSLSRFKRISTFSPQKFIDTTELCTMEIHNLLWTCFDLKTHAKNYKTLGKPLKGKRVTLLCSYHDRWINFFVQSAVKTLGAELRIMPDTSWKDSKFQKDIGRFHSLFSDIILVQAEYHYKLSELLEGAYVPVINVESGRFIPVYGLAVLMTIQEHFGYLSGLTVGWVGPISNYLNTLIYLLPKVGVDLHYNDSPCPTSPHCSPIVLNKGRKFCDIYKTKIQFFTGPKETIKGVDLVATSKHKRKTIKLELDMIDKADDNWAFLHVLPRLKGDVSEEIFSHKNSLVWTLQENVQYSTMAIILHLLHAHTPVVPKPNFEKPN